MDGLFKDYTAINKSRIDQIVKKVNELSSRYSSFSKDKSLVEITINGRKQRVSKEKSMFLSETERFKQLLRNGQSIESIMPEALALVREATRRTLGMFQYDVQLQASIAMVGYNLSKDNKERLYERVIAEMKTGEGKTLVQTLIAYLNVLEATKDEDKSKHYSVHVMTSNDALAKRDKEINEKVFNLLGITCGFVPGRRSVKGASLQEMAIYKHKKQEAYKCDIVYATPSTIAFDYLDDNTVYDQKDINIRKPFGFAIIDEADDILIDQAINPLKLSGRVSSYETEFDDILQKQTTEKRLLYKWATEFLYGKSSIRKREVIGAVFNQQKAAQKETFVGDYIYYKDTGEIYITDRLAKEIGNGINSEEEYNARYMALLDCIRAKEAFTNGIEYTIQFDAQTKIAKIILIDQNVGRKKYSNKYTDGIQEAIESKEEYLENSSNNAKRRFHIEFTSSSMIKAMCTYPDFLSLYTLGASGMTGTSDEEEFKELYGFMTYRVPTRKKNIRIDEKDELYPTLSSKYKKIIEEVVKSHRIGRPVLIGTTSLNESLVISSMLEKEGINHQVLNAENEESENQIIEGAGLYGVVTVSTNMAGRGTDIKIDDSVRMLGGLYVIGTSKNKSPRIDRQLRGRAARQGDPGSSKYFSSLEDELVKTHYKQGRLKPIIDFYKTKDGPIKNKKLIEAANKGQYMKESKDKQKRKHNYKLSKPLSIQRSIIYKQRELFLKSDPKEFANLIKIVIHKYAQHVVNNENLNNIKLLLGHLIDVDSIYSNDKNTFKDNIVKSLFKVFESNFDLNNINIKEFINFLNVTRDKFLSLIDVYWVEHMQALENLQTSIIISSITDPFEEYEYMSNQMFIYSLIPSLFNEMITYALKPNMKFLDYQIKYNEEDNKYTSFANNENIDNLLGDLLKR